MPIRALVLSDGRPGHYNQSKGLVFHLQKHCRIEVCWQEVRLRWKGLRHLAEALLNRKAFSAAGPLMDRMYGAAVLEKLLAQPADVIIAAGGNTRFLTAYLARRKHCKSFYLGSLRRTRGDLFGRVVTALPEGTANNIVTGIVPLPIDSESAAAAAAQLEIEAGEGGSWAALIGGNGAGFHYTTRDWEMLAGVLNTLALRANIKWLITSSPRTGIEAEAILQRNLSPVFVAGCTWYSEVSNPAEHTITHAYIGAAERVYCTADSMTMLMEAVAGGKPVYAFGKPGAHGRNYSAMLAHLEQQKLVKFCDVDRYPAGSKTPDFAVYQNGLWIDQALDYLHE